jgi:hypothetical protein
VRGSGKRGKEAYVAVTLALDGLVADRRERVDQVLSKGVVAAVLTVPELEVVVVAAKEERR